MRIKTNSEKMTILVLSNVSSSLLFIVKPISLDYKVKIHWPLMKDVTLPLRMCFKLTEIFARKYLISCKQVLSEID